MIWEHSYDCPYNISYGAGPRATPTVKNDRVYIVGAQGDLHCLAVEDGKVHWKKDFKALYGVETPVWGFAGAPLVFENLVVLT